MGLYKKIVSDIASMKCWGVETIAPFSSEKITLFPYPGDVITLFSPRRLGEWGSFIL
jgi:hypothetical protein